MLRELSPKPGISLPTRWQDLKTADFARLDFERTVALLPVAAIEQHGPHLPVATDHLINQGVVARAFEKLPAGAPVLRLPAQAVGKSNEHEAFPGTLSLSTDTLSRVWLEIGLSVRRAGIRKLLILNSHGGQPQIGELVARDLRVAHQMFVAMVNWSDFGLPAGLIAPEEAAEGIHGGQIETSMMLALHPHLVDLNGLKDFRSARITAFEEAPRLLGLGINAFGWQAQDLNTEGAIGNAACATAEIGQSILDHAATGLAELLLEITGLPLQFLMQQPRLNEPLLGD